MKKFHLLFASLLLLVTNCALAASRDDVISDTLDRLESVYASGASLPINEYSGDTQESSAAFTASEAANTTGANEVSQNTGFYFSGGYQISHLKYRENEGGNILDEDYGAMNGFYLGAGYKSDYYVKELMVKPFCEVYYRFLRDKVKYKGRASDGITTTNFDYKQHSKIQRFGLKLGGYTDFTDKGEIFGYFDVGKRDWYRGRNEIVEGVLIYTEKYYWTYFGLGAGVNFMFFPRLSSGIDAEWLFAPSSKMRADLYEGGTFGLKNVNGVEIKLPLKYHLRKNLSLDLTPYFTYWHIGRSDPVQISGSYYYEPESNTHMEGVFAGLTYTL